MLVVAATANLTLEALRGGGGGGSLASKTKSLNCSMSSSATWSLKEAQLEEN